VTAARYLRLPAEILLDLTTLRHVEGRQHLPKSGPCLIVANHLSFLDAVLIFALLGGDNLTAMAAEKWERNLIFGTILRLGNAYFVQRGQVDRQALERAADWLRAGKIFGIAPEGTRSKDGGLGRARPGVAYLASLVDCPVVPIAHWGTEATWSAWLRLRRPRIEVRIGPPFRLPAIDSENRSASLRSNADEVMVHLAALMPPERRGLYARHPRLMELLAEGTAPGSAP
jgi:1-acyl-sn-glycerol-3-phosphate acyltransferase